MNQDAEIIAELKREPAAELRRLQKKPYEWKVEHALDVIREFVEHEGENGVYVSFSGGKDSLVLLHLVRSIYPDVPAVFANTGIEFPEQVKFVRTFTNVTEVYPIKHFPKIIKEDGIVYPSKEVAMYVRDAKKGCRYAVNGLKGLDKYGKENRYKARFKKWAYLIDCGVNISPDCCKLMKEKPLRDYEEQNGKSPIIGTRAEESFRRAVGWMKSGCNSFAGNRAKSTPLSLWVESDVLRYIDENGIKVSPMYTDGGMKRTGCMFCPVPIAHGYLTNVEYARTHHPKIYETMMIKHGLKAMLDKAQNHNGQLSLF
jgi:3'-phosphoadenosine 5'-phosphosulfate sulfotransferase (PAPS reductase)/FAD synthetase